MSVCASCSGEAAAGEGVVVAEAVVESLMVGQEIRDGEHEGEGGVVVMRVQPGIMGGDHR